MNASNSKAIVENGYTPELDAISRCVRQQLHLHPEPAKCEEWTTALIAAECKDMGLELLPLRFPTGALARLRGSGDSAVLLRADIDAVSLEHPLRQPFGRAAHRCGHDWHTAALLGAARLLSTLEKKPTSDVYFLFQPAEEGLAGAQLMLTSGLRTAIDKPLTAVFGMHNRPDIPAGDIVAEAGPRMAGKTCFRVTVFGKTGHGGEPHRCIDPIVAACQVVTAAQTIVSRGIDPLKACVFSFCSIMGGSETNLAPESVTMTGSVRAFDDGIRDFAFARLTAIAEGVCTALGCSVRVQRTLDNPTVDNCVSLLPVAKAAAQAVGTRVLTGVTPAMGSEDFSLYGELAPYFYYWVGSGKPNGEANAPWHDPAFEADEGFLPAAIKLFANAALLADGGINP